MTDHILLYVFLSKYEWDNELGILIFFSIEHCSKELKEDLICFLLVYLSLFSGCTGSLAPPECHFHVYYCKKVCCAAQHSVEKIPRDMR